MNYTITVTKESRYGETIAETTVQVPDDLDEGAIAVVAIGVVGIFCDGLSQAVSKQARRTLTNDLIAAVRREQAEQALVANGEAVDEPSQPVIPFQTVPNDD